MLVDWFYNWEVYDRQMEKHICLYLLNLCNCVPECLSHHEPACSGASHGGGCAQECD